MGLCKKNIIFLSLLVCFLSGVEGQVKESRPILPAKEPFIIELKITKNERIPVSCYGYIVLKDMRPDNSKMGYVVTDSKKNKLRRIVLSKDGEANINKLFNSAIVQADYADTLVLVLNDLWFNETRTDATEAHKLFFGLEKLVSSCYLNADIFLQKNSHYKWAGNFDSVLVKKGEWLPNNCDKLLERSMNALLKTADAVLCQLNKTALTYNKQQFDSLINSQSDYPVLKAERPAKGIYFTYNDFLDNKPADIDFTVVSDISRRISYPGMVKEDTLWGYSDGENIFMHIANGFYLLNRTNSTYEVMGPAVVELVNPFFNKVLAVAVSYATPPTGFINPMPFFSPGKYSVNYFKYFRLSMKYGLLY